MRSIRTIAAIATIATSAVIVPASAASAANEQFDGVAEIAGDESVCDATDSLLTIEMSGGLEGCWYTPTLAATVETPSGVYQEVGAERFEGCLVEDGVQLACGTFETTYRFTAKFTEDGQQHGRCQHPIVAGSGTGGFAGATGRVDFKDNVELGNLDFRGHIGLAG